MNPYTVTREDFRTKYCTWTWFSIDNVRDKVSSSLKGDRSEGNDLTQH